MKCNLNVAERVVLLNILPREGNMVALRLVSEFSNKLGFSEEDIKKWAIKQDGNRITWNQKGVTDATSFEIGDTLKELIANRLKELDGEKKLTIDHMSLFDKFVESK